MIFANFPCFQTPEAADAWRVAFASNDEVNAWMRAGQDATHPEWMMFWVKAGAPAPSERPVAPLGSIVPMYVAWVLDRGPSSCTVMCSNGAALFVPFPRLAITQGLANLASSLQEQRAQAQRSAELRARLAGEG